MTKMIQCKLNGENITTELLKNEEKCTAIVKETQKITAKNHTYVNRR